MRSSKKNLAGFYFYKVKGESTPQTEDSGKGRISNALSKAIAYERTPNLFDTSEIRERDKILIDKLKHADEMLCIDRRNKPVVLTSYQHRILVCLSCAISQEAETNEEIKKVITSPMSANVSISRIIDVTYLAKQIFGSTRKRYKDVIINEIFNLSRIYQVQHISLDGKEMRITAPFISTGVAIEDLSPEKQNNLDYIEIIYGRIFFINLNNRYAVVRPNLFEVWRKSGRGTELFSVLLSSIFFVYWNHRQAANNAERRIRKEKEKYKTESELGAAIAEARKTAMSYELNVSSIKDRISADYISNGSNKARFWKDIDNAIEGFKELGLIEEARILKGSKGQEKVIFVLSESYHKGTDEEQLLPGTDNGGLLPFKDE